MKLSPTQIHKARNCLRIIGFEYVEGIKAPATEKQEFGKKVHRQLEKWLSEGIAPDKSAAGRVAQQGIKNGWLPAPSKKLKIEHKFEFPWDTKKRISMGGFIDCISLDPLVVIDHKTTSDLRWAMTVDQLSEDPQALIYSAWAMLHFQCQKVRARWIYYAASNPRNGGPRKPRGALPVEIEFDARSDIFRAMVQRVAEDVEMVVEIRRKGVPGLELPASPGSCGKYGGCFYQDRCNLSPEDRLGGYMERG